MFLFKRVLPKLLGFHQVRLQLIRCIARGINEQWSV